MIASIPSPPSDTVPLIGIKYYGLMIALGVVAGVWLARKRFAERGYNPDLLSDIAVFAVPAGLIGARVYHVATDWNRTYSDGRWWPHAFQIWKGGLGIPGGVLFGTIVGLLLARKFKVNPKVGLDAAAPAIPLAQAIGRLGNWFNQELYGRPTNLPWALEIDPAHRPVGSTAATYHPTFLYEGLWNIGLMFVLLWIDKTQRLRTGKLFPLYVTGYFTGRWWVESLRVDTATELFGLRVNTVLSMVMIAVGLVWFAWGGPAATEEFPARPAPKPEEALQDEADGEDSAGSATDSDEADSDDPDSDTSDSDEADSDEADSDEADGDGDDTDGDEADADADADAETVEAAAEKVEVDVIDAEVTETEEDVATTGVIVAEVVDAEVVDAEVVDEAPLALAKDLASEGAEAGPELDSPRAESDTTEADENEVADRVEPEKGA
jgi:prolipoprotein diacylglyceryl transferase